MALSGHIASQCHWPGEPGLSVLSRVLALDRGADDPSGHDAPLLPWVSGDAGLVGPASPVHFRSAYALKPDFLAGLAMDGAIYVMEGDGEAQYRSGYHCCLLPWWWRGCPRYRRRAWSEAFGFTNILR